MKTVPNGAGPQLERSLGLPHGVGIIVGMMIGGGIFISPGGVLKETESVGVALVIWTLCGVIALLGGLCYAELGTSIAKSGASYSYVLEIFGEFPAFVIVWTVLLIFAPVTSAIKAMAFAQYVTKPMFMTCESPWGVDGLIAATAISKCQSQFIISILQFSAVLPQWKSDSFPMEIPKLS